MANSEMGAHDNSAEVLSLDSTYKSYELDDADAIFRDMRRAIEERAEKSPDEIAAGFEAAARSLGTHGPKLANPRSPDRPFTPENTEPEFRKHYSGDGKYGRFAKALLRPIDIIGQAGNANFAERLEARSNSAALLENAFARVFGPKALDAVKSGLQRQKENIGAATAHHENYPMIFVPGPDRDLVLTPLSAFSTLSTMERVKKDGHEAMQMARGAGSVDAASGGAVEPGSPVARGAYCRTSISDKPQNTAIGIPKSRLRFFAKMPDVLEQRDAEIHAWTRGGKVPRMRDPDAALRLECYAELLQVVQAQTPRPSEMSKLDALADWLVSHARRHTDDIVAEAGADAPDRPRPAVVLARLLVVREKRDACRNALRSAHFQDRAGRFEAEA